MPVSSRAFDILLALVRHAGRVVEKDELMRIVWPDTFVVDDNLSQQISALRKALGDQPEAPTYILTVPRRGYQLLAEVRNRPNGAHEPTPQPQMPVAAPLLDRVPHAAWRANFTLIATTIAIGTLVAASAMVGISGKPAPTFPQAVRFVETPPTGVNLESAGVISPDGRTIVYVGADSGGQTMLMRRDLDGAEARPLPGTEGASTPFWSPDSQFIGFFGENALKTVKLGGDTGSVRTLTLTYPARGGGRAGGTWSQNNVIVYAPSHVTELYAIAAGGGKPRPITSLSELTRETAHLWPQFLPDGRHFLYGATSRRREDSAVYL
ncbi:MAG: winged helix-turn-helix domain-containing protein, partial [Vicinamibacterales bacterium]